MGKHRMFFAASVALAAQTVGAQGLPNEIEARKAADVQLQRNIDAEAATRAAGDTALQNNIASEASTRLNADRDLEGRIAGEVVNRMQAIDELRTLIGSGSGGGGAGGTVNVDCGAGGSLADALAGGAARIIVRGTCTGPVVVNRDDVVLEADAAGGSIQGTDPDVSTVLVTGHRVTVAGLTVSGGRN